MSRFLCRLGWHRWKPVCRHLLLDGMFRFPGLYSWGFRQSRWEKIANQCTRCGKRRN